MPLIIYQPTADRLKTRLQIHAGTYTYGPVWLDHIAWTKVSENQDAMAYFNVSRIHLEETTEIAG
jgi:hypothetical protein